MHTPQPPQSVLTATVLYHFRHMHFSQTVTLASERTPSLHTPVQLARCSGIDAMLWCFLQVKEVFAVPGGAQGLIRLLATSSSWDLLVETAWVLCHATHSQADANRLVHLGLVQSAMQQIRVCTAQVWPHLQHSLSNVHQHPAV